MTHEVTDASRALVENAAGSGLSHDTICKLMTITGKTLRKRYRRELDQGMAKAHFNVAKTTYEQAVSGRNPTMTIWYEKTRMGMRETMQVTTPPGEPIESKSSEAELIGAYYRRLAQAGIDPVAADGGPAGADSGADPGVGAPGQEPHGPGRGPKTRPG